MREKVPSRFSEMELAFLPSPQALKMKIISTKKRRVTPYIHCSKMNSAIQAIKNILNIISSYADDKQSFNREEEKAASTMMTKLDEFTELLSQCQREVCITFLLSTPISATKEEVKQFRHSMKESLLVLGLTQAANYMEISDSDLTSQDLVDMKRIGIVLEQLYKKNQKEAGDRIEKRFQSLEELGVHYDAEELDSLTIPEIPESLKLLIKHEDCVFEKTIGRGQSGTVYLGHFKDSDDNIAIKVLSKQTLSQADVESYRREVYFLTILSHPSLTKFCGYTEDAPFYICTEFMSGGSLYHKLRNNPEQLNPTTRSLIALTVARGLEYLHSKGVIHRDLKSLNVLLDDNNNAKICDFGMVRTRDSRPMTGMIGTVHWMAPEVLMSTPFYDERVDVYSFGIFLWELLTGQMPYKDMQANQIIRTVTELGERPPIPEDCPQHLAKLITKCWSQDPEDRPTMAKVVAELQDSKYHLAGTDEAEFALKAGIVSCHKTSLSLPYIRKETPKPRPKSRESQVISPDRAMQCMHGPPSDSRKEALMYSLQMCGDQVTLYNFLDLGFTKALSLILTEQSEDSETVMTYLLTCREPKVFDIEVLKALLLYTSSKSDVFRNKALSVLLSASLLRFEFLKSAPSFVQQLLQFIYLPMPPQSSAALLQLANRLIRSISNAPTGLWEVLLWARLNLPQMLTPLVLPCMIGAVKFVEVRNDIKSDNYKELSQTFNANIMLFKEILKYDDTFEKLIPALMSCSKSNDICLKFIIENSKENSLFAYSVVQNLPFNFDVSKIVAVYKNLFLHDTKKISQIQEFYSVIEYLMVNNDIKYACEILKTVRIEESLFVNTKLPKLLSEAFYNSDDLLCTSLMLIYYNCLQRFRVEEFVNLDQIFLSILFGKRTELRKPAFLCVISAAEYISDFDYSAIHPVAAFYVHSSSEIIGNSAAKFISEKTKVCDDYDIDKTLEVFIENYKAPNKNVIVACDCFVEICKQKKVKDQSLLQKLSQMYNMLHSY